MRRGNGLLWCGIACILIGLVFYLLFSFAYAWGFFVGGEWGHCVGGTGVFDKAALEEYKDGRFCDGISMGEEIARTVLGTSKTVWHWNSAAWIVMGLVLGIAWFKGRRRSSPDKPQEEATTASSAD